MDKNERIHKNVLAARAESGALLLLTQLVDKKIKKHRRRRQIIVYIGTVIVFFLFSALAFYMGTWLATSMGFCIG
jgi:hypothetical protein